VFAESSSCQVLEQDQCVDAEGMDAHGGILIGFGEAERGSKYWLMNFLRFSQTSMWRILIFRMSAE